MQPLRKINGFPYPPALPCRFFDIVPLRTTPLRVFFGADVPSTEAPRAKAGARGAAPRHAARPLQAVQSTSPLQAVPNTTSPKAMRYQANGTKLWVEM